MCKYFENKFLPIISFQKPLAMIIKIPAWLSQFVQWINMTRTINLHCQMINPVLRKLKDQLCSLNPAQPVGNIMFRMETPWSWDTPGSGTPPWAEDPPGPGTPGLGNFRHHLAPLKPPISQFWYQCQKAVSSSGASYYLILERGLCLAGPR